MLQSLPPYLYTLTHLCKLLCHFSDWLYVAGSVVFSQHYWVYVLLYNSKLYCLVTIMGVVLRCSSLLFCFTIYFHIFLLVWFLFYSLQSYNPHCHIAWPVTQYMLDCFLVWTGISFPVHFFSCLKGVNLLYCAMILLVIF